MVVYHFRYNFFNTYFLKNNKTSPTTRTIIIVPATVPPTMAQFVVWLCLPPPMLPVNLIKKKINQKLKLKLSFNFFHKKCHTNV